MPAKEVKIIKASGETVLFDESRLIKSLRRSGASEENISAVVDEVRRRLHEGITTKEIYRVAFKVLKSRVRHVAARYNLKRAIMALGPSGFPFEQYIAEILKYQGFKVRTGEVVMGFCVKHEVDVIAEKDEKHFMVECKFHNEPGNICDVKAPLYINSRFHDIEKNWKMLPSHDTKFHQGWVVTNTRFSDDAITYGICAGLYLLGWNYPVKGSLRELIDASGLHPLTALTTLTAREKELLLNDKIVLCRDVYLYKQLLASHGISAERQEGIIAEAKALCGAES